MDTIQAATSEPDVNRSAPTKRVAIATLGCKVNSYESELIAERLVRDGYTRVDTKQAADLYIINSCTVTAEADRQSRQFARKLKRLNPQAKLVMTGCFAQNNPQECAHMDAVDLVVGNAAKLDIPILINQSVNSPAAETSTSEKIILPKFNELMSVKEDLLTGFENQSRAFIQIQQGCNQGCTFCIIHTARGPSQSFATSTVLRQVEKMASNGYKEVVICGVDLGSYGEDLSPPTTLTTLLRQILALGLDCRFRVSSIDPIHITDELIELYRTEDKICPHVHLSMQSASSLILKRMKRRANREHIYHVIQRLREARPELVVSADVLVGFPTEEIDHFADTLTAVNDLNIAYPHVFPYSARDGTPAAKIPRQVPTDEKKRRAQLVREAGVQRWNELAQQLIGSQALTIVESINKQGHFIARRADYYPIEIHLGAGDSTQIGQWATVKINQVEGQRLIGELIA
ncbi:MAG: threonylcarbamoyladenosine tRNA methylthiotransferase MtaB [Saprospiraceae bacterium]|jgi:threonylcarbamoyladenosine tRNA methylthiotransferase MtaB